jgi:hypothetical protein
VWLVPSARRAEDAVLLADDGIGPRSVASATEAAQEPAARNKGAIMQAGQVRHALRTRTVLASSALLLGAAVTGFAATASAASSATAGSPTAARAGTVISFTLKETSNQSFELGNGHGVRVGSVQLNADDLMQGTKQIGHDGGSCVITRFGGGTADDLCTITMVLPSGQIDLQGLTTSTKSGPGPFQLAITGGTGTYRTARGYAAVEPTQTPKVTLHISA